MGLYFHKNDTERLQNKHMIDMVIWIFCNMCICTHMGHWAKGPQAGHKATSLVNWQVELNEGMRTQRSGPDYEITQNQISEVAVFVWLECGVKWKRCSITSIPEWLQIWDSDLHLSKTFIMCLLLFHVISHIE